MTPWKLVVIVAGIGIWSSGASAQQLVPSAKMHRSPAEIAAKSELTAEKNESCRLEAKKRKLHLLKRRRFMRDCVKG
jgi:hypothetical protein